jgi:hypothetical protein
MQTFQDFISRRFQYNEDSGMQPIIGNSNIENVKHQLFKIIEYVFSKGNEKKITQIMDCLSGLGDPMLTNDVEILRRMADNAGNKDLRDVGLGNVKVPENENPAIYPNQQQDGSSHF